MRGLLLAAGALLSFTFAPYNAPVVVVVACIACLYYAIQALALREGLIAGWFFGLGYFGLGVNWVYHSIHLFGAAVAPLAAAVTALFVLVMTVFPALSVWLFLKVRSALPAPVRPLVFAAIWVLAELARGKIMGGFPWILLGYSQASSSLGAFAPFIGVYGISFILVLLSAVLVELVLQARSPRHVAVAVAGAALVTVSLWVSSVVLDRIELSQPKPASLQVRLVQANIAQELKFSESRLQTSLQEYVSLSSENNSHLDLIIWPETAIPTYFANVDDVLRPFAQHLYAQGIDVLSGGFYYDGKRSYNSVRQLAGDKALYQKRHLVPFGEYMPMRFLLDGLAKFIEIPMSDLGRGSGVNRPLPIRGEKIGVSICYEDVFGEEMRAVLPESTLLVNVSNDAWFGDSAAPYQHQQKAQMRAREMARPLVRVTNTGVSSVIDHKGRVLDSIGHDTRGYIDVEVTPRTGFTPYARTGNWPVALLCLLLVFVASVMRWRSRV